MLLIDKYACMNKLASVHPLEKNDVFSWSSTAVAYHEG